MEMQMTWRLSKPSLSSFASCEVFVCCSQPLRLTHSLNYSDRWHFLERSGLFWFFLTNCPCCSLAEERIQCWLLAEPCLYLSVVFWLVWALCSCRGTVTLLSHCHMQLDIAFQCWRITQESKFTGIFVVHNFQHSLPLHPLVSHLFLFSHTAALLFLDFLNMTLKPGNTCEFSTESFCSSQDAGWAVHSHSEPAILQSAGPAPAELWCSICVINIAPQRWLHI